MMFFFFLKEKTAYEFKVLRSFRRVFFFFQAEDGIRDSSVTGVQTCALPISINYKIFGDLTQVASAQVQVKDDTGQVVFSTPVPVQPTGSVTWPSGQPIHVKIGRASCRERV